MEAEKSVFEANFWKGILKKFLDGMSDENFTPCIKEQTRRFLDGNPTPKQVWDYCMYLVDENNKDTSDTVKVMFDVQRYYEEPLE